MSRVDWRWAAKKGFFDPVARRWNTDAGGYAAYAREREMYKRLKQGRTSRSGTVQRSERSSNDSVHLRQKKSRDNPDTGANVVVERPLSLQKSSIDFDREGELLHHTLRHGWAYTPLRRFWTCGYQV